MKTFIRVFALASFLTVGLNASALIKECNGGENSESVLGAKIVIDIYANQLDLVSTNKGYEDAVGPYPFNGITKKKGVDYLEYQGGDPEQQEGYRFLVEPAMNAPQGSGTLHVRLDSGIEGYIDAVYTCHDPK